MECELESDIDLLHIVCSEVDSKHESEGLTLFFAQLWLDSQNTVDTRMEILIHGEKIKKRMRREFKTVEMGTSAARKPNMAMPLLVQARASRVYSKCLTKGHVAMMDLLNTSSLKKQHLERAKETTIIGSETHATEMRVGCLI